MKNISKIAFCFCLTLFVLNIAACTPVVSQRGNMLQDFQITEVKVGESSRYDVLRILGSPTTQSTFNPDVWYYIGQETAKHGILDDETLNERVVSVSFTPEGIVKSIENVDGDKMDIPYARAKTPTHGNDLTFMQQLLGNMGRFNAPESSPTDL